MNALISIASNCSDNSSSAIPALVKFRKVLHPSGSPLAGRSPSWDAVTLIIFKTDLWIRVEDLSFYMSSFSFSLLISSLRSMFASLVVSACAFSVALSWA